MDKLSKTFLAGEVLKASDLNDIKDKTNELIDEVGEKLELKDFQLLEDVQNDDLLSIRNVLIVRTISKKANRNYRMH